MSGERFRGNRLVKRCTKRFRVMAVPASATGFQADALTAADEDVARNRDRLSAA